MKTNISLAAFPGVDVLRAMELSEKLPCVSLEEVQICPQNPGTLTPDMLRALRERYPGTRFRLHANVRAPSWSALADASSVDAYQEYFSEVKGLNAVLGNPPYILHAGARRNTTLSRMLDNVRRIEDEMGCPVGVEGMYPRKNDRPGDNYYLLANAEEYAALLNSGVHYAVDLSHLNIVRCRAGLDLGLVKELVASERCIEVHVSGNDGVSDTHAMVQGDEWWWPMIEHVNPNAVVFTEENRRRR